MATIDDVIAFFAEQRTQIADLDRKLSAERKKIKKTAFLVGRKLTNNEIARRKEIGATQMELAVARKMMGQSMIDHLEIAEDVDDLISEIDLVNAQLEDDLKHLKTIDKYAASAAKVLDGLANAVEKLIKLRPTL